MHFNLSLSTDPEGNTAENRREKLRFPLQREVRYKLLKDGAPVEFGAGQTIDIGSGGVSFELGRDVPAGVFIELAISWPVLLGESCAMRLIAFGRVVRCEGGKCACTMDKYEFRTQSRVVQPVTSRTDTLRKWADTVRRDATHSTKPRILSA